MGKRKNKLINEKQPGDPPADAYHIPVMLQEATEGLKIQPGGIYVDCTFGGGGHSRAILSRLHKTGRLIVFDQDKDVLKNLPGDERVIFVPHNFRHLQRFLRLYRINEVDGVLADLGVSGHQFDEAERGFSIRFDAPLDMRMDRDQLLTAATIIQNYSEENLQKIFSRYGEITNARTLAHLIIEKRKAAPIGTISAFTQAIASAVKGNPNKYLAQVFQALRIEVNDELEALKEMLQQAVNVLKPGGRLVIITFHSLEDRIVKHFFRSGILGEAPPAHPFTPDETKHLLKVITKKPLAPSPEELQINKRARSARLRIAERI